MSILHVRKQSRKLLHVFVLLFLVLNLVPNPGAKAQEPTPTVQSVPDPTCDKGWVWATGPEQPLVASSAKLALRKEGIEANVTAFGFGEKDSCGKFELFSTDFSITLTGNPSNSLGSQSDLANNILSVLSKFGTPQLGNVQITFEPGNTKFYPSPSSVPEAGAMPNSSLERTPSVINKKVYLLVYDPILSNAKRFSAHMGWSSYTTLVQSVINSFNTASNGQLQYTVVDTYVTSSTSEWPIKIDGFRYTESAYITAYQNHTPHDPNDVDYDAIIDNPQFDICGKLNRGEIDELWIYGGPYDGFYESRLVGPDGYWFNSPPMTDHNCNKLLPIMGLNFERGVPEALHSFGHRTESSMTRAYGDWQQNRTDHNWDRYALVKALSSNYSYSGCGNIHFPPNGVTDYDYANAGTVLTNCDDFGNYPNLGNPLTVAESVTCTAWGCTGDSHLAYMTYWFSHLPSNTGCAADGLSNNWWLYFADPNLALTPSLPCPAPPCPTITDWKGQYWSNATLTGQPVICRNDPNLDLDWGLGSPDPIIPNDNFSARWTRTSNFNGGKYRFHFRHDDGARLYIDNVLKLDVWDTCCVWETVDVQLSAGAHKVQLDYFENNGAAHAQLWWEQISQQFISTDANDGWILESSETSAQGNTMNTTATVLNIGDDAQDKQYRSFLSFDTSSLPNNAVITNVQLKINVQGFVGGNMFTPTKTLGNLLMDIRQPYFGTNANLAITDFQAASSKNSVGSLASAPATGWYTVTLKTTSFPFINLAGATQFRLRFTKDDNDDLGADYLKIYSGNAGAANCPQLIVEYYVP